MTFPSSSVAPPAARSAEIRRRLATMLPWHHNVELAPGVWTNPAMGDHPAVRWALIEPHVPRDLRGKSVLDLGCSSGFFSAMLKRRGADRVVAVDVVDSAISEARLLTEVYETPVEIVQRDAYEFLVDNRDQFDHVLFLGLFYHLRSPLFVLDRLAAITRERLYFQTWVRNEGAPLRAARRLLFAAYQAGVLRQREGWRRAIGAAWHTLNHRLELGNLPIDDSYLMSHPDFPRMSFIPRGMNGDTTNWWVGDTNTVRAILDSAGFRRVRQLSDDTFLCDNAPEPARDAA